MVENHYKETCKGCYGLGIQVNSEGLRVVCPICGGKGFVWRSNFDDVPPGTPISYSQSNSETLNEEV